MIKSNPVKALLKDGKPAFGTWITLSPHPRTVKIFASSGLDFVILEMEHTDFSVATISTLSMLAREAGLVPIVRTPGTLKAHDLTRALDGGAQGLLLPSIDTAGQIEEIITATKYYPRGNRPMNLKGPHTDYFTDWKPAEIIAHLNEQTMSVVLVETQKSIDNLDAICKVDGVDAVMIGPDDLSQDLGVPGEMGNPKLLEAFDVIFDICKANGVPYGLSCHTTDMARKWVEKGCTWLPYSNDAAMVMNAIRVAVPELMKIGGRSS
ncbi:MAG: aldolase [Proteobacteria bacterium]|nr:aldolase [Pseudomonadota bacterium]